MLACYLTWHLRRAWAPLTFTDQDPPAPDNPVAPARRSAAARAKASGQHDQAGRPYHSFRGLLEHLATLTRNQVRYAGTQVTIPLLAAPGAVADSLLVGDGPSVEAQPDRVSAGLAAPRVLRANLKLRRQVA